MEENILDYNQKPPTGKPIGGWLYLFDIIFPLSIFKYLIFLFRWYNIYKYEGMEDDFYYQVALSFICLIWVSFSFILFTLKKKSFTKIYLIYLYSTALIKIFAGIYNSGYYDVTYLVLIFNFKNPFFYEVIFVLIITFYFKTSERVSQTFVKKV